MPSEWAQAELEAMREEFASQMKLIAEAQRKRAALTASGTVMHGRITVTVNADNVVIETRFAPNIGDLTYTEIARGMTEAAQAATAEVARKSDEVMQPLRDERAKLPTLAERVAGLDEFQAMIPVAPPVSTAPPQAAERPAAQPREFTDAEDYERVKRRSGGPGVVDRGR